MDVALTAFAKYMVMGGYVMPPLVVATMALWFGLGFRLSVLRTGAGLDPRPLLKRCRAGQLRQVKSPVERAVAIGVEEAARGAAFLRDRLDDRIGPIVVELGRYRALTGAIVAVAPLLGLLGTVSGMIETFASLGDMTLYSQSGGIAGGISQALLTTQFGLVVAIPGLVVRGLLDRRQRLLESQIEEIKNLLVGGSTTQGAAA